MKHGDASQFGENHAATLLFYRVQDKIESPQLPYLSLHSFYQSNLYRKLFMETFSAKHIDL